MEGCHVVLGIAVQQIRRKVCSRPELIEIGFQQNFLDSKWQGSGSHRLYRRTQIGSVVIRILAKAGRF
jgi:hypothetical protein